MIGYEQWQAYEQKLATTLPRVKCKRLDAVTNPTFCSKQTLTLFLKLDQEKLFVLLRFCNMSWDIWILEEKQ